MKKSLPVMVILFTIIFILGYYMGIRDTKIATAAAKQYIEQVQK